MQITVCTLSEAAHVLAQLIVTLHVTSSRVPTD